MRRAPSCELAEVKDLMACRRSFAGYQIHLVIAVQVVLVGLAADLQALQQLLGELGCPPRDERRQPIEAGEDAFSTAPGLILPGQRDDAGTRKPPSYTVPLVARNGVIPPSGQVKTSAPLSVVKMTIVLSATPISVEVLQQIADVCHPSAPCRILPG